MFEKHPVLHVVTSGSQPLEQVLRMAEAAWAGGMDMLQLREKQLTARECMKWVEALADVMPRERILVNDRVDAAAASRCGGAHLAYHSLTPQEARRVLKEGQLIGRSVHSREEAEAAVLSGADYLYYGHVFASQSKPGLPPRGTEELVRLVNTLSKPIIAIGGITPDNLKEVLATGCAGVAILSGITGADDPKRATLTYREAMKRWQEEQA
ncbi:thiamine phosphate synthase [Brevibacillus sp. H7]|uniref:thiamine phosphate synthase n=1 Tax=Brevibacillus sp. H7 TaxID=3349138 RepID=UPI00382AB12A